jgi:hypothetical protein
VPNRRYLNGHLLCCGPEERLRALERRTRLRCVVTPRIPQEAFLSIPSGRTRAWQAFRLPPPPRPRGWDVRQFVIEGVLRPRVVQRRIRRAATPLEETIHSSLDYEVRAHQEGVHGSPTPFEAIYLPDADEGTYREQEAFRRIGLLEAETHLPSYRGEGCSVVIFDSGPELAPNFDPELVDVYIPWPVVIPEDFPAFREEEEPELEVCTVRERRRMRAFGAHVLGPDEMEQIRALHGVMIASIIRRIAPGSNIVLVRLMDMNLGTTSYELIEAMRYILQLWRSQAALERRPVVYGSLVFNLSLGVVRSQAETVQSCVLLDTMDRLSQAGVVLVAATGNLSEGRPENATEPAAYGYFGDTRACATQVIPVAAASFAAPDRYAWFSNEAHFAAPGEDLILDCGLLLPGRGRYVRWSGTSFAAAITSGIVARLLSTGLPPDQVKQRLWEAACPPRSWDGVYLVQVSH